MCAKYILFYGSLVEHTDSYKFEFVPKKFYSLCSLVRFIIFNPEANFAFRQNKIKLIRI